MAACNMASAASGLAIAQNVANNNSTPRPSMFMFNLKNINNSRLVVRAADEAAPPAAATATASEGEAKPKAAKPPPVGPKRGSKVKILRKESYWFKGVGSVVTVDQDPKLATLLLCGSTK